jgi:8-oxo-dGTP diphosphatase
MADLSYKRVVCFLIKDDQVLLGKKKTGLGQGNFLGMGGKMREGEIEEQAVIRETQEEISVTPIKLTRVAELDFLFPHKPEWDQHVTAFVCTEWKGEPTESEEIAPQWFNQKEIPYKQMWDDASYWLRKALTGKTALRAWFKYDQNNKVSECDINENTGPKLVAH